MEPVSLDRLLHYLPGGRAGQPRLGRAIVVLCDDDRTDRGAEAAAATPPAPPAGTAATWKTLV